MTIRRRTLLAGATAILAAPHVARAATRRFRLGHNNTTSSVLHAAATGFDEALKARSDGRFSIEIAPNSTLGTEVQMLTAVSEGTLDMSIAPSGTMTALNKEVGLLETPYLFRDAAHARSSLDGPLGKHCSELLAPKGVIAAAWGEVGIRHVTANKPIRTPAELKGLKIRVPLSDAIMLSFRAMGAQADALAFSQLQEALRTGRFDAQENPINIIVAAKLNTHQSHVSLTGHVYTPAAIVISADVIEELSPADRAIVVAAAQPGAVASRALADRMERDGIGELRAAGMTIVTDVDVAAMRQAATAARAALATAFGADSVERIGKLVG